MSEDQLLSIGDVSKATGVNAITLRAWQRRYGLLKPKRTTKGRRQYTEDDITRIKEILSWLDKGVAIGKVQPYLQHKKRSKNSSDAPDYLEYQNRAINAVQTFNQPLLESAFEELFSLYPLDMIAQNIYPDVLATLDKHWRTSDTAFSEQEFFEFYLRNKLASTFLQKKHANRAQKIVIVDLENTFTDIEMLFMAAALSIYGFAVVLLGHGIVPREWAAIVKNAQADGMIVCIRSVGKHINQVNRLAANIDVPLFVRTRTPQKARDMLDKKIILLPEDYQLLLAAINNAYEKNN
jgi:DNA-binding transcriptional MerR regulator